MGGFKTKEAAEQAAKVIAEFVAGDTGWAERIQ
jgi:hypothetical protein